jgi:hypothetical protein
MSILYRIERSSSPLDTDMYRVAGALEVAVGCDQEEVIRLITAAPELLSALKLARDALAFVCNDDGPVRELVRGDRECIPDPRASIMALIERIEGKRVP